ncbi:hypothetical protein FPV67DRAFT_1561946 [Lyophyllum atratum]|nr:hypothetical protein FPV67DRAFT_1561946 [Lyophyllum atratum]
MLERKVAPPRFQETLKVHDHAKVKLGPGFDIQELETGFETPWIYLGNVPGARNRRGRRGSSASFRLPIRVQNPSMLVRARFSSPAFGCKISARLPDTAVRIRWEAPGKVGYGGYSTMEHAKEALVAARIPFGDHYVHASVHVGLPVVGVVTEDMARFARPDDINLDYATQGIKRLLQENTELLDFVVLPPPYRSGAITRVFAQHVQSLTFSLSSAVYEKMGDDIQALCATVHHVRRTAMSVVQRPAPLATLVKLSGDDLKELGLLKAELEKILKGETVHRGANIAWDPFFAHPAGRAFLERVEREAPAVTIHVDTPRRMIRLLGSSRSRLTARQRILAKIDELQSQQIHTIPLDGWLLGYFMGKVLMQLQNQVGREHVDLDFCNRRLVIRGSDTAYKAAREAVRRARQARLHPARRRNAVECPVCFDEVTNPVTLPCGHSWCRDCISRYLTSAIDNKYFPLTCLGGNAKCREHIPLQVARQFLTISEFDAIVDAALAFYIHSRPDEFHYCPSPDCPQIYRRAPRETVLQCPSCLLRICPSCHVEAHDGFTCPDPEGDNKLFRVWMKNHDVKPCPGCKVPIERAEGCHHMTCTQCKTHICWVCLQTFPKGDGIYDHMRAVHGGIGLGAD